MTPNEILTEKLTRLADLDSIITAVELNARTQVVTIETATETALAADRAARAALHAECLTLITTHQAEILGKGSILELAGYQITNLPGTAVECVDEKAAVEALEAAAGSDAVTVEDFATVLMGAFSTGAADMKTLANCLLEDFASRRWKLSAQRCTDIEALGVASCLSVKKASLDKSFIKKHWATAAAQFRAFGLSVITRRHLKLERVAP